MTDGSPPTGKVFGHYRIQGQLGAGGMGVVYSAYDTVLERKVAIKVMVDRVSADKTARDLLLHEARAASSLNHPNICTIHEVGDSDGEAYIVMEQVEGQPLSSLLGTVGLSPELVVRYGIQIADALAHAHEHGVIHRDLKSTNAMVTPEGRIKVLDFGLASRLQDSEFREATSSNLPLTESRMIVGTLPYLAPELLRGEPAEVRADIWALGVLLYEMASGTHPFRGRTAFELSSAILREPPTPLPAAVPSSLGAVIFRCLEKSPGDRYQRASDVRADLQRLKPDEHSVGSAGLIQPQVTEPALSKPTGIRGKAPVVIGLLVLVLLMAAMAFALRSHYHSKSFEAPFQHFTIAKLTDTSNLTAVAISADGKYLVNVARDGSMESLWLRNVVTNSDTQIVAPMRSNYSSVQFSSDGDYVYFCRGDSFFVGTLYRVPVLGGNPSLIAKAVVGGFSFSPNDRSIARYKVTSDGQIALITADVESGQENQLLSFSMDSIAHMDTMGQIRNDYPAWSPDGKTIVVANMDNKSKRSSLIAVEAAKGKQQIIVSSTELNFSDRAWLPDGSGLAVVYSDRKQTQIGFISYPQGLLRAITRDTDSYSGLSLDRDGKTLATIQTEDSFRLYLLPARELGDEHQIAISSRGSANNFVWEDENNLILTDSKSLFRLSDRGERKATLIDNLQYSPRGPSTCGTGPYIVFLTEDSNGTNLLRMDKTTGDVMKLAEIDSSILVFSAVCSPNGKWVYFVSMGPTVTLQRVAIDGGPTKTLSSVSMLPWIDISRDGKTLAFTDDNGIGLVDSESGDIVKKLSIGFPFQGQKPHFTPDDKSLAFVADMDGVDNIWAQPLDGSSAYPVTHFKSDHIYNFCWSPNGEKLGVIRGSTESNVVLIHETSP